jgi:hypothetical protein
MTKFKAKIYTSLIVGAILLWAVGLLLFESFTVMVTMYILSLLAIGLLCYVTWLTLYDMFKKEIDDDEQKTA